MFSALNASSVSKKLRKIPMYRANLERGNIHVWDTDKKGVVELALTDPNCAQHAQTFVWNLPRGLREAYRMTGNRRGQDAILIGLCRDSALRNVRESYRESSQFLKQHNSNRAPVRNK